MESLTKNLQDSSSSVKVATAKPDALFSSPFWKKVQKNLNQEAEPIGTKTSVEEARQLEQKLFWDKVERGMDDTKAGPAEESSAPVKSFKPLSLWEKVPKKIKEPAAPVPLEPMEKPTASFVPGSFWSKVSKNMDGGSVDSGVGDVTPKSAAQFTPLSFWDKVSKKIDGASSPDSGLGDMGSTSGTESPVKASVATSSFWEKVSKNKSDTGNSGNDRGRPATQSSTGSRRRFTPQMISTTKRSYRKSWMDEEDDEIPLLPHERGVQPASFLSSPGSSPSRRRFAPQLIETAKRTHKAGDKPKLPPRNKAVGSPDSSSTRNALSVENAPNAIPSHIAELLNKSNQGPQRKRHPTRRNTRGHSFKVPDLESIDSSESEEETTGPPSYSSSQADPNDMYVEHNFKHATRIRESVDDRFAGYLLRLAAEAAQKQLLEQAEAAFPNSEFHEPVTHYMDRESDESGEESSPPKRVASRTHSLMHKHRHQALTRNHRQRNDSDEERIALEELQKHHERMSEAKKRGDKDDPWSAPDALKKAQAALQLTKQRDAEARQMRKAASPPMLGGDINFPRCRSPEPARFDVTQGSDSLRNSMCALTQQANEKSGLWGPSKPAERLISNRITGTGSGFSSRQGSSSANNGLWGGFCTTQDSKLSPMPTGLQTPMYTPAREREDPFAAFSVNSTSSTGIAGTAGRRPGLQHVASTSKPPTALSLASDKLELEVKVNAEFTDEFVTQVYNYLSLGYPSLARKFDDELSHISRVDIEELRQDDKLAEAKGYVRLGEDEVTARETGIDETMCARWRALRLYIREWGRQQAAFAGPELQDPHRAWGSTTARRGSWGN